MRQPDVGRFVPGQKINCIPARESHIFQVNNDRPDCELGAISSLCTKPVAMKDASQLPIACY
jgi:hypothetical protein